MTSPGSGLKQQSLRHQHLLLLSAWRYARQHYWQTWLSFIGIALGVMMVVAVDLANSSAQRAFDLSVETVSGTLTHQISGGSAAVPDDIFRRVRTELGFRRSAPTLTAEVRVNGRNLTLLGLDLFSEASLARQRPGLSLTPQQSLGAGWQSLLQPDAAMMQESTAQELGLQTGERFDVLTRNGPVQLLLAATLPAGAEGTELVMFTDIATAQELAGRIGVVDSIDLVLDADEAARLQQWLPASLTLVSADGRNASLQQMTSAFHTNLLAMSLLALLVAALLIYNTVSLSVVQRQETLGVLRSLGVTGNELIKLVLLEVAVLTAAASIAGLLLGLGLGQVLVKLVTRTVDDLYFNLTVTRFLFDPLVLVKGFAWGMGISLLAAALPAWQAGQSRPITLQQHGSDSDSHSRRSPLLALGGLVLISLGYGLLWPERGSLLVGFIALNCIVFGSCFLVPLLMHGALTLLLRLLKSALRPPLRLALRNLQHGLGRTALAVAALTVAVSVTVGVGVMTGSFRDTVILWLEQSLRGDVMVGRNDGGGIDAALAAELRVDTRVATLENQFMQQAESDRGAVVVLAESSLLEQHLFVKEV
ncbi:MAG: FtsX-like permease family protein, partial [Pseudomonadota bacterium]